MWGYDTFQEGLPQELTKILLSKKYPQPPIKSYKELYFLFGQTPLPEESPFVRDLQSKLDKQLLIKILSESCYATVSGK